MRTKEILINIFFVLLVAILALGINIAQAQDLKGKGDSDRIPLSDPYCGDGGYLEITGLQNTEITCTPITTATIPEDVADWVLIELRSVPQDGEGNSEVTSATPTAVVALQPAWLLSNGHVVDANSYTGGCTTFSAENPSCPLVQFSFTDSSPVDDRNLYVVVRHINHLDIISSVPMGTTGTETRRRYIHDFTEGVARASGGSLALKAINEMQAAMYVGDINRDANINAADYLQIFTNIGASTTPTQFDINFDGVVNDDDAREQSLGENLGRTTQLP